MMIWSCRIQLEEVEKTLRELDPNVLSYQVVISEESTKEVLALYYEKNKDIKEEILLANLYKNVRDLKDTITLDEMSARTRIIPVEQGMIPRNSRTGKISLILDKRK
jgi:hypothetical protein